MHGAPATARNVEYGGTVILLTGYATILTVALTFVITSLIISRKGVSSGNTLVVLKHVVSLSKYLGVGLKVRSFCSRSSGFDVGLGFRV